MTLVHRPATAGLLTTALGASLVLGLAAVGGAATANGIGDLYVAASRGVLELHVSSASIVNVVDLAPGPTQLAFAPDGRTLYVAADGRRVTRVDIETISVAGSIDLPAAAAALAHPQGEELVLAFPSSRTLGVLDEGTRAVIQSRELPGAPDLLATDRRDRRVVAAAAGGGWIALFDPGTGSLRTLAVEGRVAALALSHADGAAYVATRGPNRVVAIRLDGLEPSWSASLPSIPTAVARLDGRVVAAAGSTLWTVGAAGVARWATAARPVAALAPSDEGTVLYAGESDRVEAFGATGRLARTIVLAGTDAPVAIAPVPAASSIAHGPDGTPAGPGSAASGGDGGGSGEKPPATDTILAAAAGWVGSRRIMPEAMLVAGVIFVLGIGAIHWYERRGEA